ncbi:MAG: O-antigen ligase family protein [Patescibacteria group bacterium]|nr:O-antigen ligase family protein [Patescibacteria group bacterium]
MNVLIIIYLILFAIVGRLNLKLAVLLLILTIPSYLIRLSIFGLPSTLLELSLLLTFANWIIKNYRYIFCRRKRAETKKVPYPFGWEIILILVIALISTFVGGLDLPALGIFRAYFLEPIFLYILILNTIKGEKGIKQIINALCFSVLIISIIAIWQKITGQFIFNEFWANIENRRVVSIFNYPNALALFIGPIIPLIIGSFLWRLKEKGGIKTFLNQLFLFITALSGILAIYFAKSKGALTAIFLAIIISIFILIKRKIKIIILILFLLAVPSLIYYQKDWINLKLSSSLSWQIRQVQWQETKKMLQDGNILWGAGLNNYQEKIEPYHQEGFFFNKNADPKFRLKVVFGEDQNYRDERWQPLEIYLYPHNIFLNFWSEIGLIGALLFTFVIIKFLFLSLQYYFKEKNNKNKYLGLALGASMLVIIIHGLVDVPYFKNDLASLFWIIISILAILRIKNNAPKLWKK